MDIGLLKFVVTIIHSCCQTSNSIAKMSFILDAVAAPDLPPHADIFNNLLQFLQILKVSGINKRHKFYEANITELF